MSERLVGLLNSALGVWRETVDSQDRLSTAVDNLQAEMNDIKEFSALPIFRAGLPLLESNISRVQACKKRIAAVGARLKRVDLGLQPYRQRMKIKEQQAKARADAAKPPPAEPPKEPKPEPPKPEEAKPEEPRPAEPKPEEAKPDETKEQEAVVLVESEEPPPE
jgi:hypothetical protein